jgi:hypothetical protein
MAAKAKLPRQHWIAQFAVGRTHRKHFDEHHVQGDGNMLYLSWPADHLGWILQSQTNNLGTGLGTNRVDVAGSALVTSTTPPFIPGNPTVFDRLRSLDR